MSFDLAARQWTLTGRRSLMLKYARVPETAFWVDPKIEPTKGKLPGSVQESLRRAGILSDWHDGLESRAAERVEHRHLMIEVELPEMAEAQVFQMCRLWGVAAAQGSIRRRGALRHHVRCGSAIAVGTPIPRRREPS
jgi:hypothetical protein